ncbi:MAG: hypothetical protein ACOYOL_02960 [Chthoniobacterales bacterium]
MKTSAGRLGAMLLALLMAAGTCCCHGALLAELARPSHSCCEGKAKPAHESGGCQCASQILAEGKVQPAPSLAPSVLPVPLLFFEAPRRQSFSLGRVSRLGHATAHAPPPREARRFLQVWLI